MLGKLIKNEFKATYKMFGMLFGSLIVLTLLTRFCVYIPFDNIVFDIMTSLLTVIYVVAIVCMAIFSFVLVIKRFYQNMLNDQGYLSHTLPVKMWQQITAKTITYVVWIIASLFMMLLSLFLYFVGKSNFTDYMNKFIKISTEVFSYPKLTIVIVSFGILVIMQLFVNILNVFAAFSLGQIFTKHKVLGAIVFYFVLNYAMSFVVSAVMLLMPDLTDKINVIGETIDSAKTINEAVNAFYAPTIIYLIVLMVLEVVLGVIYFAITNYMLSKRLNLE